MDTTIRNLDEELYRELKARAARSGKTVGEMVNEAMRAYLGRPVGLRKRSSLLEIEPEEYSEDDRRLSGKVDTIVCEGPPVDRVAIRLDELPPEVVEGLERRAAENARSLEEEVRAALAALVADGSSAAVRPLELVLSDAPATASWRRREIYGADGR